MPIVYIWVYMCGWYGRAGVFGYVQCGLLFKCGGQLYQGRSWILCRWGDLYTKWKYSGTFIVRWQFDISRRFGREK